MQCAPGDLIPGCDGKTKSGSVVLGQDGKVLPGLVWFTCKTAITKHNDPTLTREFAAKATTSAMVNDCVMRLLLEANIPVAYRQLVAKDSFIADACKMLPLEVVARRYFVGSSLKRHPELKTAEGVPPVRTDPVVVEFYLKTTSGKVRTWDGGEIDLKLKGDSDAEDPIIYELYGNRWGVFHPKRPREGSLLCVVDPCCVLPDWRLIEEMDLLMRRVFLVLETAWGMLDLRFIDLKIEFGITPDARLVVADIIDNDSWRLKTAAWEELSKEAFRQNEPLSEVERKYLRVTELAQRLRYSPQAFVPLAIS